MNIKIQLIFFLTRKVIKLSILRHDGHRIVWQDVTVTEEQLGYLVKRLEMSLYCFSVSFRPLPTNTAKYFQIFKLNIHCIISYSQNTALGNLSDTK